MQADRTQAVFLLARAYSSQIFDKKELSHTCSHIEIWITEMA